jgi:predicted nucleotidyltransferase
VPPDGLSHDELKRALAPGLKAGGAERAILFGSCARGEADEYSDVDLVIVKSTETPFLDRYKEFEGLFNMVRKALDVLVYTPEEFVAMRDRGNPLILKVMEDGIVIYEA